MSKKPSKPDTSYEANAIYEVKLLRSIKVGGEWARPGDGVRLKGKMIVGDVADAIETATKIS